MKKKLKPDGRPLETIASRIALWSDSTCTPREWGKRLQLLYNELSEDMSQTSAMICRAIRSESTLEGAYIAAERVGTYTSLQLGVVEGDTAHIFADWIERKEPSKPRMN